MFCKNCGKELTNEEKFCPSCGKNQKSEKQEFMHIDSAMKSLDAFYIALITSPLLFIIRMLTQTTKSVDGGWRSYDVSFVPGNIQAIMIVILIASTFLNISLRKDNTKNSESKARITKLLFVVNIVFGVFVTFMQF